MLLHFINSRNAFFDYQSSPNVSRLVVVGRSFVFFFQKLSNKIWNSFQIFQMNIIAFWVPFFQKFFFRFIPFRLCWFCLFLFFGNFSWNGPFVSCEHRPNNKCINELNVPFKCLNILYTEHIYQPIVVTKQLREKCRWKWKRKPDERKSRRKKKKIRIANYVRMQRN